MFTAEGAKCALSAKPPRRACSSAQLVLLGAESFCIAVEDRNRPGLTEPRFAGISGIEVQRFADGLVERFVRMAEHDNVRLLTRDAALEGFGGTMHIHDVMNQELASAKFEDLPLSQ